MSFCDMGLGRKYVRGSCPMGDAAGITGVWKSPAQPGVVGAQAGKHLGLLDTGMGACLIIIFL